jgi:hypothetical protein
MKKILIASLALITFGCASMVQKGSIKLAYSNFEDRDYEDTLQYISQAENEKQPSAELKAELTYLKAQTYEKMGNYDKSQGLYEYLKDQHSESQYGYLAAKKLEQKI